MSTLFVGVSSIYFIRDKVQSLFERVILGSLKTFFQLDHQVDLSCCFMEAIALHHSKEFSLFDTVMMYF